MLKHPLAPLLLLALLTTACVNPQKGTPLATADAKVDAKVDTELDTELNSDVGVTGVDLSNSFDGKAVSGTGTGDVKESEVEQSSGGLIGSLNIGSDLIALMALGVAGGSYPVSRFIRRRFMGGKQNENSNGNGNGDGNGSVHPAGVSIVLHITGTNYGHKSTLSTRMQDYLRKTRRD